MLTTHTGSLPRPMDLVELLNLKELGKDYDVAAFDARVKKAIADIVIRQSEIGLDIVDDGEHSKVNWMAYARGRLSGLEELDAPSHFRQPTRDSIQFAAAYEDFKVQLAARSHTIVPKRQSAADSLRLLGAVEVYR